MTGESAFSLVAALRSWAAEDAEGRVMTVVEDPSVVDYVVPAAAVIEAAQAFIETTTIFRQRKESQDAFEALALALIEVRRA